MTEDLLKRYEAHLPGIRTTVLNNSHIPLHQLASLIAATRPLPIITTCELLIAMYGENKELTDKIVSLKVWYKV